ncbi:nitrous oxide reductase family maturation protein NosD [Kitasatospora sp. NPDC092948]|uniref:right-handed parallel beta-helix repeat-containing protein n=1 Tax=Kitasatospora sp. NPDC092948 TaxID=3364088 RepID=UPI00381FE890
MTSGVSRGRGRSRWIGVLCGLLLGLAAPPPQAFAAFPVVDPNALYVSAVGTCPSGIPPAQCFTTVIDAVHANEADGVGGRTVYVDDGVYTGSFLISKPIDLIGTSKNAVIQTTNQASQILTSVAVQSSNVTIEGLTIKSYDAPAGQPSIDAVCVYVQSGPGGAPISNVTIRNNDLQPGYFADASADNGYAVLTQYLSTALITDLTVEGNTIEPLDPGTGAARPLVINAGTANTTVQNNTVTGTYVAGSLFSGQNGNVVVTGNRFDGVSDYSILLYQGGWPVDWGNVVVTDNEFSHSKLYPIYVYDTQINRITGNTFTDIVPGAADLVAVHQYLGTEPDNLTPNEPTGTGFVNTPYIYAQPQYTVDGAHYVDYVPETYTVEYYKDSIAPGNEIGTPVKGVTFLSNAPITEAVVDQDLGVGWIDARRPAGYSDGVVTFPPGGIDPADDVVRVLYTVAPSPSPSPSPTQPTESPKPSHSPRPPGPELPETGTPAGSLVPLMSVLSGAGALLLITAAALRRSRRAGRDRTPRP